MAVLTRNAKKRRERECASAMEPLPAQLNDDLILEILTRVSCKTLIRSKCVSKAWGMMISNPSFMKSFKDTLFTGFFFGESKKLARASRNSLESVNQKFSDFGLESVSTDTVIDTRLKFLQRSVIVVSSHNGFLLCVVIPKNRGTYYSINYEYIVCNPLTKQWVDVANNGHWHNLVDMVLFTYKREESMEFKVICLHYRNSVDTYSSEKRKWEGSGFSLNHSQWYTSNKVLFQESVYVCCNKHLLWGFDVKKKVTTWRELPPSTNDESYMVDKCLGVSAGSLCYADVEYQNRIRVWVFDDMTEWSLKHNIKMIELHKKLPRNIRSYSHSYYPCAFHPVSPYLILVKLHGGYKGLLLYNADTEKIEMVDRHIGKNYFPVVPYSLPAWTPCLMN